MAETFAKEIYKQGGNNAVYIKAENTVIKSMYVIKLQETNKRCDQNNQGTESRMEKKKPNMY